MTISINAVRVNKVARFMGRYYAVLDASEGWERIPAQVAHEIMTGNNIVPVVELIKEDDQVYRLGVFQYADGSWTAFQLHGYVHPANPRVVWQSEYAVEVE